MEQGNSAGDCLSKIFKVYLPGESGGDLELPISFNSVLPKYRPKTVTVRSIYGNIWKMALRKSGGKVEKYVLVNGWKRIVEEEGLNCGDLLTFEFDGSRSFNFCIYEGRTMCKKLRRSSVQTNEIKTESDGEDVRVLDDDEYDDDSDDDVIEDVESVDVNDDRKNPSFMATVNPKKTSQLVRKIVKVKELSTHTSISHRWVMFFLCEGIGRNISIRCVDGVCLIMQRIPAHVIKDYDLNFPECITVVDPLVAKYGRVEKKIMIHANGSVFVKRFGSIIRRNKVTTTDKMICELKKKGSNNLVHTMKVSVVSGSG